MSKIYFQIDGIEIPLASGSPSTCSHGLSVEFARVSPVKRIISSISHTSQRREPALGIYQIQGLGGERLDFIQAFFISLWMVQDSEVIAARYRHPHLGLRSKLRVLVE